VESTRVRDRGDHLSARGALEAYNAGETTPWEEVKAQLGHDVDDTEGRRRRTSWQLVLETSEILEASEV
jgi:hypothetical protein